MFNFKKKNKIVELDYQNIPNHIAIIMDGNGRWAQERHLPRIAGHKQGMNVVKKVTKAASDLGVKVLTLYAFSTENWKRPEKEVNYLMDLPERFFNTFVPDLVKNNVKVNVMGYVDQLPKQTQTAINNAINDTKDCTGMVLNFALNYGSQDEIVTAVKSIAEKVSNNELSIDSISKEIVADNLMTANLGEYSNPDLLIRTSGEERLSNFLLWQLAYSEFVFDDTKWPDYTEDNLKKCILTFQSRHRRFGGLTNK